MQTDGTDTAEDRLHELRHRYRNSLQIINSLVGLHARGIADPIAVGAFADLRSRLSILSTIFMDLDEEGDQVELGAFLPRIARRASNLEGSDGACPLHIDMMRAHLDKSRAGILAQILAEMLMAAFRSCRQSGVGRPVDVRLAEAEAGRLALTVAIGGGSNDPSDTVASKLSLAITRSMAMTLDAAFEACDADGAARLTFAVAAAAD